MYQQGFDRRRTVPVKKVEISIKFKFCQEKERTVTLESGGQELIEGTTHGATYRALACGRWRIGFGG